MRQETRQFLGPIESARGIAAFSVAFGHALGSYITSASDVPVYDQTSFAAMAERFVWSLIDAQAAVVFFFVMSGMVLGLSLDRSEDRLTCASYGRFLWRRVFRIYPAHLMVMLPIMALLAVVAYRPLAALDGAARPDVTLFINTTANRVLDWKQVAANTLLLSYDINSVTWSLQVEMAAAFLLPLLHVAARRRQAWLDIAVLSGFGVVSLWCVRHGLTRPSFFVVWLAAFHAGLLVSTFGRNWATRLIRLFGSADFAIIAVYLAMMLPGGLVTGRPLSLVVLEIGGCFAMLSLLVHRPDGKIAYALENRALRWNGKVSYSFYLWHLPVLVLLAQAAMTMFPHSPFYKGIFVAALAVSIPAAWLMAWASYTWIECPGRALSQRTIALVPFLRQRAPAGRSIAAAPAL